MDENHREFDTFFLNLEKFNHILAEHQAAFQMTESEILRCKMHEEVLKQRREKCASTETQLREAEALLRTLRQEKSASQRELTKHASAMQAHCLSLLRGLQKTPGVPSTPLHSLHAALTGETAEAESPVAETSSSPLILQPVPTAPVAPPVPGSPPLLRVTTLSGGINLLEWDTPTYDPFAPEPEYEVAVAVGDGLYRGSHREPLADNLKGEPDFWHYHLRTHDNPYRHTVLHSNGRPVGSGVGVLVWYRTRLIRGLEASAWSDLIELECNQRVAEEVNLPSRQGPLSWKRMGA